MILPLRRVHRATFALLPAVLIGVAAAAFRARQAPAGMDALPSALGTPGVERVRRLAGNAPIARLPADWNEADALVYWAAAAVLDAPLPADAELVGCARAGMGLPRAPDGRGTLVYSLAHGRVLWWRAGGAR